jgi:hypothetical protein
MNLPIKRALLSGLIYPGIGQFANKQRAKGFIFSAVATFVVAGLLWQFGMLFIGYFKAIGSLADPTLMVSPMATIKTFWTGLFRVLAFWGGLGAIVWVGSAVDAYYIAKMKYGDIDSTDLKSS